MTARHTSAEAYASISTKAQDARCAGCAHRREESTQVPQDGTGGVR